MCFSCFKKKKKKTKAKQKQQKKNLKDFACKKSDTFLRDDVQLLIPGIVVPTVHEYK